MAKKLILWPIYFDANKSRGQGRRVPTHLAVTPVSAEDVLKAAKAVGYEAELDSEAKHPATWFESSGRIFVAADEPKTTVIRKVAEQLKKTKLSSPRTSRALP
ncbi:MAG: signal recognition particle subunit SRP19/SEC65 family protein [Thermofilaceae archaeon]